MAPDPKYYDDEEDIDFSDLHERFEVQLEEGLDAFVVVDGLPSVPDATKGKLIKFLAKKLTAVGRTKEDSVFMPTGDDGNSQGFAFVEYETPEQAAAACSKLNGLAFDKKHTISVNKLTDIERYGREGRIEENYVPPPDEEFVEMDHLRSWLGDENARDQFILYRGDDVGVFWNERLKDPEMIVNRPFWTESFVRWSPLGTFLTSMHAQGVQLWGGQWKRIMRFMHPAVNLVDFSPNEKFLVTWSNKPIVYVEGNPVLGPEEDGNNFIIWDVATGALLRSFPAVEEPASSGPKKINWPVFKWTLDDKYFARITPGKDISVYESSTMMRLQKSAIKIDGVMDFEWSPHAPSDTDKNKTEQLLCYWTPEVNNQTARVALMAIPSREVVRTRNLFNVSDCKLHWQSEGTYLCVKVDRHTKTKKSTFTNLEFFRVKDKNIPIELVEIKDTVINFAWEPKGDRFVLITTPDIPAGGAAVPPKTSVSFYAPEKATKGGPGGFRLIRTYDKKNSNSIFWCPKGRFVVVASINSQQGNDMEFWDLDFEGEKKEAEKDLAANLMLMKTVEHYGVTDIDWDPTGRYVTSSASMWKHAVENGYRLWDFKGEILKDAPIDRFKQIAWRPRPPTLLSVVQQKNIRKNLREYGRVFEEEDNAAAESGDREVMERRRNQLDEWRAWRDRVERQLREEREDMGLAEDPFAFEKDGMDKAAIIEEIVEEVIDESEEIIS